ncbi:adenosine deaminase [Aeromicrobium sp. PE09-221]|uniref:adenosine deaminase family protein n=1 Tax=Aeromicrobium sp. PE09-221 TaxID=1898043 RepID=UPI000B3E46D0|nr:adenosine deaminase [Aeromicrobium sp. PE09-221]OUZ08019.1 adenosine deaminase [Aeromicrobium sp. PE09-221]
MITVTYQVAASGQPQPNPRHRVLRAVPKVSLHCHLLGSVRAQTVVELAGKHDISLDGRSAENLYDHASYEDLGEFLRVLDVVGSVVRDLDDLHRITYESLIDAADHQVLYREIQISPPGHGGVPYRRLLDGITAGMRDARTDAGIDSRIVVGLNREQSVAAADALLDDIIEQRIDEVVGIGLDYAEALGPPEPFAPVFQRAASAGLQRTAHSETGPPRHIEILLDELGCSRIDHGYHVVDNDRITRRCAEEGVPFICTPVSSDIGRYSGSGDGSHRRIAQMVNAGLAIAIDSDDPPMFGTDPTRDLIALSDALGYGLEQFERFTHTAVDATWLDDTDRAALRQHVERQFTALKEIP